MHALVYRFGDLDVEFAPEALAAMLRHRQTGWLSKEAGGQMFARLSPTRWRIEVTTGPRRGDQRGRFHFWPDRKAEQEEINRFFEQGLEFVGDWHTHPEEVPRPSASDIVSAENIVRESTHHLPGILMCIVGRRQPPAGLWLSLHHIDGRQSIPSQTRVESEHGVRRFKRRLL